MIKLTTALFAVYCLLGGCGGDSVPGVIGDPCEVDEDCEGICLTVLRGEWHDTAVSLEFPGGMCSEECEDLGGKDELEETVCLVYRPTGEQFLFPLCKNDCECRVDEGYLCITIGWDKVCLPPGV